MKIETIAAPYASDDARWAAVQSRDPAADGVFYYSVRTTGVYCRPSCGARPHCAPTSPSTLAARKPKRPAFAPACAASRTSRPCRTPGRGLSPKPAA
jgi:methylphosphotriester-DNA--protein-cysteine methyltransferase